jgi:ribosome maturation factor RimP
MNIQEQIQQILAECISDTDCFVVSFKVRPTHNYKIFLDSDTGLTLEKSILINRRLRHRIDESGMFPDGDYSLEVSSPGVDEPLKLLRQYQKNIGRKLEIVFVDEEKKGLVARLKAVDGDRIQVEELIKPKRGAMTSDDVAMHEILLSDIASATVLIEF